MEERPAPALTESESLRQNLYYVVELLSGQLAVWVGLAAEGEQFFFGPFLLGAGGYNLLG
jgi:hypothetical protein